MSSYAAISDVAFKSRASSSAPDGGLSISAVPRLRRRQCGVSWVLFIVYTFVRLVGGWSETLDSPFLLVVMCVAGDIITKLARNYGIERTGRLGVGAKAVFTFFVLQGLIGAVVYLGWKLIS